MRSMASSSTALGSEVLPGRRGAIPAICGQVMIIIIAPLTDVRSSGVPCFLLLHCSNLPVIDEDPGESPHEGVNARSV